MRRMFLWILCLLVAAAVVPAQKAGVNDGDIVVANFRDPSIQNSYGNGSVFAVDVSGGPQNGMIFTVTSSYATFGTVVVGPNWVEMASDNSELVVAGIPRGTSPLLLGNGFYVHQLNLSGAISKTMVVDTTPLISYCNAFDLDGDGSWILAGGPALVRYDENTNTATTIPNTATPTGIHNAFCIDRGPGSEPFVVGKFNASSTTTPKLLGADMNGFTNTISTSGPVYVSAIRLDHEGDAYIGTGFGPAINGTGDEYVSVDKSGSQTVLNTATAMYRANGVYLDKKRIAWILTYDGRNVTMPPANAGNLLTALYKMDLTGTFLSIYTYSSTLTRAVHAPSGVTEYGCRHVVCNGSGKPGTSVQVRFSSRNAADAGKAIQLAASVNYRPGIQLATGEWLNLDVTNPMFFLSATSGAPAIFKNFANQLDAFGNPVNPISVAIPASIPPGLGITVFVSGVVIDPNAPSGVGSVGNTHWFVLS